MTQDEQFFFDTAGFSYNPATETEAEGKLKSAIAYAAAEAYARNELWYFEWVPDLEADPYDWDGEGPIGNEAYGCILRDASGKALASLWGIWDPDGTYRRVVQAELALEAKG